MPSFPSFLAAAVVVFGAAAQGPEHRPLRPKGRYFTQDQLQRAMEGTKTNPAKRDDQHPAPPPSEMAKSLLDFAKQNPELAKSLLEAARNLAKENPDLLRGGNDDAAKRLAEQMAKQSNFGELLKNLQQKPPPSNVKRPPSEETDENGRRDRTKKDSELETNPQEPPRDDGGGRAQPRPRPTPESDPNPSTKERSPLADLAGESPDFVKSLLEQAKMKVQNGRPPTNKQIDEAVRKAVEEMKHDPAYADWIRNPKTQEKIRSPKLRDDVKRQLGPQTNSGRGAPQRDFSPKPQPRPDESPNRPPTLEPYREPFKAQPDQPEEMRSRDPLEELPKRNPERLKASADSLIDEQMKKVDAARKRVAKEMEEQGRRPGERRPAPEVDKEPANAPTSSPNIKQLADLLRQNPGLLESVAQSAGADPDGLKGMLDALKGTDLEKQFRDLARELNKDGSLNDLIKGRADSEPVVRSSPRNRPREDSPPMRSAAQEASKAFKSLAGDDFSASKLGDTMKSLGEAIKKRTEADYERAWSPPRGQSAKTAADGLGDGWIGMLGRGAAKVGEWGANATQKISQQVAPGLETPNINPPAFSELKALSMPTAEAGGRLLLVFGILAAIAVGVWMLLRRTETALAGGPLLARLPKLNLAGLPPREQAALLFERAALERLGEPARPKNHVALARKLCNGPTRDSHLLAEVYETARYSPPTDPFQPENVGLVREIISRQQAAGKPGSD